MAVSATATTQYTVDQIVGLAMVTAGVLHPQHYIKGEIHPAELSVGRMWLFFKLQSMQASGDIMRARDRPEETLVEGQAYVVLDADTVSVENGIVIHSSTDETDRPVELINLVQYQQGRPDKTVQGSPVSAYPEKQADGTWRLYLWPVPDADTYTSIIIPRSRRLRDVEEGSVTLDLDPKMHLAVLTYLAARFAVSKGRSASAGVLGSESDSERGKAESDDGPRGDVQFIVGDC